MDPDILDAERTRRRNDIGAPYLDPDDVRIKSRRAYSFTDKLLFGDTVAFGLSAEACLIVFILVLVIALSIAAIVVASTS